MGKKPYIQYEGLPNEIEQKFPDLTPHINTPAYLNHRNQILNAYTKLYEALEDKKISNQTFHRIEKQLIDLHQAIQHGLKPVVNENGAQLVSGSKAKAANKSFNRFVRTQTVTMIGKHLLLALNAVIAGLTAFKFENVNRRYESAKHEARLHKDIKSQIKLFNPRRASKGEAFHHQSTARNKKK